MKKITVNILCSTGITLIILAAMGKMIGANYLFISSVFQSFAANVVIYTGLLFTRRFESRYPALEYTLDIGYTIAVVLAFGAAFDWYSSTPVWILIIMTAIIYLAGILLSILHMRRDIKEINVLLQKRDHKSTKKEPQT